MLQLRSDVKNGAKKITGRARKSGKAVQKKDMILRIGCRTVAPHRIFEKKWH